jgi:hypothetical protein
MATTKKPTIEQFNTRLRKAVVRLIAEAARLKVTPAQLAALALIFGDLITKDTWCYVWELYAGGDVTSTKNVKKKIKSLRRELEKLLSDIYDDIPKSIWNDDDRSTFGRATGAYAAPTEPGEITDQCIVAFMQYGGGKMKAACKSATDQSRASKAKNSDGVQFHFVVVDQPRANDPENEQDGSVRLDDPELATNKMFFTSATFTLELGATNSGRRMLYFIRWYNSKHPKNAGPWMGPYGLNIL